MPGNWIKLHRKLLSSRVFSDPQSLRVWLWCLMKANWKPGWFHGEYLEAGQFATGQRSGAIELDMPQSTFYRRLKQLEKWKQISLKVNRRFTIVSICKWDTYQVLEGECESQMNRKRITDESQMNTIEEREEGKDTLSLAVGDSGVGKPGKSGGGVILEIGSPPPGYESAERISLINRWLVRMNEMGKGYDARSIATLQSQLLEYGGVRGEAALKYTLGHGHWSRLTEPPGAAVAKINGHSTKTDPALIAELERTRWVRQAMDDGMAREDAISEWEDMQE